MISGINWWLTAFPIDFKLLIIIYRPLTSLKTYQKTFADSWVYLRSYCLQLFVISVITPETLCCPTRLSQSIPVQSQID